MLIRNNGVALAFPARVYDYVTYGELIGDMLVAQQSVTSAQVEQAVDEQESLRSRKLGDQLVSNAIVSSDQLMLALEQQDKMPMIRVGEALVRLGYIDEHQLNQALERQKTDRTVSLGQLLVDMGFVTRRDLHTALARKMGYPVVDVMKFPVEPEALRLVPLSIAQRLGISGQGVIERRGAVNRSVAHIR